MSSAITHLDPGDVLVDPVALWRRISARIDERLQPVERAIVLLLERTLRADEIDACAQECTLIADWVFALEMPIAGRIMRQIGHEMSKSAAVDGEELSSRDASGLAMRIEEFRSVLRVSADDWLDRLPTVGHVHVVSQVDAHVDAIMWHLRRLGVHVTHTPRFAGAPMDADAMALFWPGDPRDVGPALLEVGRTSWKTRRIVVHGAVQTSEDLAEIASNTDLVLPISRPADELADEIRSIVMPDAAWVERVVVLDGSDLAAQLRRYHFEPIAAESLSAAIRLLALGDRTLVLGQGDFDPAEVIGLVRSTPDVRDSVVAVRCDGAVPEAKCRQLGADIIIGADDDVDVWGLHLRGLVTRRNRSRQYEQSDTVELPPWSTTRVLFERALGSLGRTAGTAALAVLEVPDDVTGERAGEIRTSIGREFRSVDLLGHSSEGLLLVLLRGATREKATARLEAALENIDVAATPGRVGVSEFPVDGFSLGELMSESARAMDRARSAGGPAVVPSDWHPDQMARADVVLVESDRTLASILTQLLDQLSLSSEHLLTGSDALSRFTRDGASQLPRLLIVELDAMGADGLMVLRSLARHGILSRTKVIVTCARIRDGELREAFELGADDVVVKPFSAVVLSNRIEQVLNAR